MVAELAGRLVGVASYVRQPGRPAHAEVAFAVSDVAQGHGIGTQLLACSVGRRARAPASRSSRPTCLATTTRCCRSSAVRGSRIRLDLDAGVYHLALNLSATPAVEAQAAAHARIAAAASMRPFFAPGSVAVIGASQQRGKIGAEVLHNLIASGFTGRLFAVHPSAHRDSGRPGVSSRQVAPGSARPGGHLRPRERRARRGRRLHCQRRQSARRDYGGVRRDGRAGPPARGRAACRRAPRWHPHDRPQLHGACSTPIRRSS